VATYRTLKDPRAWLAAVAFVAACFLASGIGQLLGGSPRGEWYRGLAKPTFTPPSWVFGPAWTALYICMGLAGWLVWLRRGSVAVGAPLALFAVQLALNAAWTPLFFGLRSPGLAMIDIVALWLAILLTAGAFFRVSAAAGWLMLPYLLWVSFAAALNFSIWRLNA